MIGSSPHQLDTAEVARAPCSQFGASTKCLDSRCELLAGGEVPVCSDLQATSRGILSRSSARLTRLALDELGLEASSCSV